MQFIVVPCRPKAIAAVFKMVSDIRVLDLLAMGSEGYPDLSWVEPVECHIAAIYRIRNEFTPSSVFAHPCPCLCLLLQNGTQFSFRVLTGL